MITLVCQGCETSYRVLPYRAAASRFCSRKCLGQENGQRLGNIRRKSIEEKFWNKIVQTDEGCWLWMGQRDPDGYGKICVDGGYRITHRFSYELLVGPIAAGLTIDHLCRTRSCVNPGHMEVVSLRENVQRGYQDRGFPIKVGA